MTNGIRRQRSFGTAGVDIRCIQRWLVFLWVLAFLLPVVGQEAPSSLVLDELRALGPAARAPGTPGNLALDRLVAARFKASGLETGELRFRTPVFVPGATSLQAPAVGQVELEVMHPTLMRPGNFAETEFESRLVYFGQGTNADLRRLHGVDLKGTIALLEYNCSSEWLRLLTFGVKGFIFIGTEEYQYFHSYNKLYDSEVAVPRFFVPPAAGARLRVACRQQPLSVKVQAQPSKWQLQDLRNLWVLVPGADEELKDDVAVFTAPMDANSIVPARATGARSLLNLHLLLKLLADFRETPTKRSVLLVAVNAHTQRFLGERVLAWQLISDDWRVARVRDDLAKRLRRARLYHTNYSLLKLEKPELPADRLFAAIQVLHRLGDQVEAAAAEELNRPPELDLETLSEPDYQAALAAARAAVLAEKKSLMAKINEDKEATAELEANIKHMEEFAALDFAAATELLKKALPVYEDEWLFEDWRAKLDESTGTRRYVKSELQEEVKRALNKVKLERMALSKSEKLDAAERRRQQEVLEQRQKNLLRLLVMFNKIDIGFGSSRTYYHQVASNEVQRKLLKGFRDMLLVRFEKYQAEARNLLDMDTDNSRLLEVLGRRRPKLVISLDLDAHTEGIGFCSLHPHLRRGRWPHKFGQLSTEIAAAVVLPAGVERNPWVDTMTRAGGRDEDYFFPDGTSPAQYFQGAGQLPAFALKNVHSYNGVVFSPADDLAGLNPDRYLTLQRWLRRFFPQLLNHPDLSASEILPKVKQVKWKNRPWSVLVETFSMDQFAGKTKPDIPIDQTLIAMYSADRATPFLTNRDVVNCYTGMSGETGLAVLYALTEPNVLAPIAYQLGPNGRDVLYTIDKGRIQSSRQMNSNTNFSRQKTLPLFPCREIPIYGRTDPTTLKAGPITVDKVWIKGAQSKSEPEKYGVHGLSSLSPAKSHRSTGPAAVYVWRKDYRFTPESILVITDDRRCLLNADAGNPEGAGFFDAGDFPRDWHRQAAADMEWLNRFRAEEMKGIRNLLMEDFLESGATAREAALAEAGNEAHASARVLTYRSLGSQVKAYSELRKMNRDLLKSILIYMGLMLPFCFFLQKLLFRFTRMEKELLAFAGIFLAMYILFRLIHPAFAIAMNPEAIFIAFILGAIGCFVTYVLHSNFSNEMALLFQTTSGLKDVGYSTVGQTALLLGVQNMKRRRVRTTLTTTTIVLVVFTMLAFSSVSKTTRPMFLRKSEESPYTGLLYHWPAGAPIDEATVQVFRDMYSDKGDVIVRRVRKHGPTWPLAVAGAPGNRMDVHAIVGLPANDRLFKESMAIVDGRFFSSADAREIILSVEGAEALGYARLGAEALRDVRVRFMGEEFKVVGLLGDGRMRHLRDLNPSLPLLPFRSKPKSEEGGDEGDLELDEAEVDGLVMDPANVAFLPAGTAEEFGAAPHSISVRLPDYGAAAAETALWDLIELLLTVGDARFYIGSRDTFTSNDEGTMPMAAGVYYVGSNYRTSIGGKSRLIIPLIIAGSIILNSLLGTVYERKPEIAIYNAIGLNPTHIFTFFLAEALVYGVIGAVGGYLIGQFISLGLKATGWLSGINVNFSSLIVVYAIVFAVGLVLLSTLYPAYVATRTAVPSGRRKWTMPEHDGQTMHVPFPFIYQPQLAPGIIYYLFEYFASCSEVSLGDLTAQFEGAESGDDAAGRPWYELRVAMALAPFDLGVTQEVTYRARFDEVVDTYRLYMTIDRVSGQDTNWVTTNKPFLTTMRTLLLHWRNVDPTQQAWYVARGRELVTQGPPDELPVYEAAGATPADPQQDPEACPS